MGRRKIEIKYIKQQSQRTVIFCSLNLCRCASRSASEGSSRKRWSSQRSPGLRYSSRLSLSVTSSLLVTKARNRIWARSKAGSTRWKPSPLRWILKSSRSWPKAIRTIPLARSTWRCWRTTALLIYHRTRKPAPTFIGFNPCTILSTKIIWLKHELPRSPNRCRQCLRLTWIQKLLSLENAWPRGRRKQICHRCSASWRILLGLASRSRRPPNYRSQTTRSMRSHLLMCGHRCLSSSRRSRSACTLTFFSVTIQNLCLFLIWTLPLQQRSVWWNSKWLSSQPAFRTKNCEPEAAQSIVKSKNVLIFSLAAKKWAGPIISIGHLIHWHSAFNGKHSH